MNVYFVLFRLKWLKGWSKVNVPLNQVTVLSGEEVFRTIRHSFGYTDRIYYNLLKVNGIVQITSKRGGIDIDNNGAAVDL